MDPTFRNLYRFLGAVLIALGCAFPIWIWNVTHRKSDISPSVRAQIEQVQSANRHGHPYIAAFFVIAIVALLLTCGVGAFKGKTWVARWLFPLFFALCGLAELVNLFL
jgi:hypothetical protein